MLFIIPFFLQVSLAFQVFLSLKWIENRFFMKTKGSILTSKDFSSDPHPSTCCCLYFTFNTLNTLQTTFLAQYLSIKRNNPSFYEPSSCSIEAHPSYLKSLQVKPLFSHLSKMIQRNFFFYDYDQKRSGLFRPTWRVPATIFSGLLIFARSGVFIFAETWKRRLLSSWFYLRLKNFPLKQRSF